MAASTLVALIGLGIGAVVGAAAFLSNFCALGAISDILFARDWRRMRAWMLAAGVAVLGTQALDSLGLIHIDRILLPYVLWLPALIGGVCFGFGMSLSGGCINRALVRLGAGSLKSLVIVIVVGLTSLATTEGVLEPVNRSLFRVGTLDLMVAPDALYRIVGVAMTFNSEAVRWVIAGFIGGGLVIFAFKDAWFRNTRAQWVGAVLIGLAIPAAWAATAGNVAINFAAPTGALMFALTLNGALAYFAVMIVIGVPVGAFIAALLTHNLALESFTDRADLPRNLVGAALMGFGGTLALGCTFGQGLSGFSTLSLTSMITIAAITFGCLWGIRYFEAGGVWAGLKMTFKRGV